jgi:hypothetical protein
LIVLEVQTKAVAPNEGKIIDRNRCCGRNHFEEKLTSSNKKITSSAKRKRFKINELNITLIDDEKDVEHFKKIKTALPKKSTVQETYNCGSKRNPLMRLRPLGK